MKSRSTEIQKKALKAVEEEVVEEEIVEEEEVEDEEE